jgi:tRNA uridine 5-carboxymethylaminomethyl modification enzyme
MTETRFFPIIVVGAGHAGCEAAAAAARLGIPTLLLTLNLSTVALMPCNPSIGGPGKGHLVREMAALGGEMPRVIDHTCLQLKWLNTSRGPAVQARRAQADKLRYQERMLHSLFSVPNLTIREGLVTALETANDRIRGVILETGLRFGCDKLILATGTYLGGRIIVGPESWPGGPHNQRAATALSGSLTAAGVGLRRLQTATPPRVHRDSLTYDRMKELPGDETAGGFCWENRRRHLPDQKPCYLTFTTEATIAAVQKNLQQSPLVLANITDDGPKHCPSIDRKVLKFPRIVQHQIFVEPESREGDEYYLQGLTTSMPPAAQREILHTVPGLESAHILRYGYAIEYDALKPGLFRKTMASRVIDGLYTAGQLNGTSGYEEAASQGLIAGINAAHAVLGRGEFTLSRTEAYLGVLIDDLSLWDHPEPYRITPFFAEFRLSLREETAEIRLSGYGNRLGLTNPQIFREITQWQERIRQELESIRNIAVHPTAKVRDRLEQSGSGGLKKAVSLLEILRRPGIRYRDLSGFCENPPVFSLEHSDEIMLLENEAKYGGYAERETERMETTRCLENIRLPMPEIPAAAKMLRPELIEELTGNRFDDLGQLAKKHCLSREELAILLANSPGKKPADKSSEP